MFLTKKYPFYKTALDKNQFCYSKSLVKRAFLATHLLCDILKASTKTDSPRLNKPRIVQKILN